MTRKSCDSLCTSNYEGYKCHQPADNKPVIPDERPFYPTAQDHDARQYIETVLPGAEVRKLELDFHRRVASVWTVSLVYSGHEGHFYLVGGDVPYLLLDKDEGLTTVTEALTIYCWYFREWHRTKGLFLKDDFFLPSTAESLDYWNKAHTAWLSLRLSYIEWKVLPKMIFDGELKNPDVAELARKLGNDTYYEQVLSSNDK